MALFDVAVYEDYVTHTHTLLGQKQEQRKRKQVVVSLYGMNFILKA